MSKIYKQSLLLCFAIFVAFTKFINIAMGSQGNSSRTGGLLMIGIIISAAILYIIHCRGNIDLTFTTFQFALLLFPTYCLFTSIMAINAGHTIKVSIDLIEVACTYYLFSLIWDEEKDDIDSLLKAFMLACYIVSFYAFFSLGINGIRVLIAEQNRMSNSYINANTLGMSGATAILINLYFLSKKEGVMFLPAMIVSAVLIVISQSRKAVIILVIGGVALLVLNNFNYQKRIVSIIKILFSLSMLILLILILSKISIFQNIIERVVNMINGFGGDNAVDDSFRIRMEMKEIGKEIFLSNPILGVGLDNSGYICGPRFGFSYYYLHDNYIELLADTGLVGFICYYFVYCIILYRMIKYRDLKSKEFIICFTLLALKLILDYGNVTYSDKGDYFWLMILWMESEKLKSIVYKKENGDIHSTQLIEKENIAIIKKSYVKERKKCKYIY